MEAGVAEPKKLSEAEILSFMKAVPIMTLATSLDNKPIASVMLYAVDDDFTLYFATHVDTQKVAALTSNPRVGLTVWEYKNVMLQADGAVEKIEDPEELDQVLDKLVEASTHVEDFWPPLLQVKNKNPYAVYKVKIQWLRALDLSHPMISTGKPPYTILDFGQV